LTSPRANTFTLRGLARHRRRAPHRALTHSHVRLTQLCTGSSTACVLVLNPAGNWLSAANLGDSGFVVVRNGTVLFQTPALQHFFDCPFQFGCERGVRDGWVVRVAFGAVAAH